MKHKQEADGSIADLGVSQLKVHGVVKLNKKKKKKKLVDRVLNLII